MAKKVSNLAASSSVEKPPTDKYELSPFEEAVQQATQKAHAGDAVLLSPACASLDMFRDYAHRAQVFVDTVQALAQDAGQDLGGGV